MPKHLVSASHAPYRSPPGHLIALPLGKREHDSLQHNLLSLMSGYRCRPTYTRLACLSEWPWWVGHDMAISDIAQYGPVVRQFLRLAYLILYVCVVLDLSHRSLGRIYCTAEHNVNRSFGLHSFLPWQNITQYPEGVSVRRRCTEGYHYILHPGILCYCTICGSPRCTHPWVLTSIFCH